MRIFQGNFFIAGDKPVRTNQVIQKQVMTFTALGKKHKKKVNEINNLEEKFRLTKQ